MTIKVLVTGSRALSDYQPVYDALDALYAQHRPLIVIHGAANGADAFADTWAVHREDVTPVRVPADWKNDKAMAGPIRNGRMLDLVPDVVYAFLQHGLPNSGTNDMIRQATSRGLTVERFIVGDLDVDGT